MLFAKNWQGHVLCLYLFAGSSSGTAQTILNPNDELYEREKVATKRMIPYVHLREADVMWSKRIWRRIDLRQKMNHPFYFPMGSQAQQGRMNLFAILKKSLLEEGLITAYDPGPPTAPDDMFTTPMSTEEVRELLFRSREVPQYDPDGEVIGSQTIIEEVSSREIKFYEIKEEWFFEKERSVLEVRILGIKPVCEYVNEAGEPVLEDLFWIYFPEARYVLANYEVYNPINDAERRSWDEVFEKRMFASDIIKESNVYDRQIRDYKTGIDALLEGERIKQEIFNFEHDLWSY